jgi:hypothetical protein
MTAADHSASKELCSTLESEVTSPYSQMPITEPCFEPVETN